MSTRLFAMTYPQLMNQALDRGMNEADMGRLRNAYGCAERLFDGVYRGQHVPFLCHVVRTAAILLAEEEPLDVIMAGLLHAAYDLGYFEDKRHGKATLAHREELRREVGDEVAALVAHYQQFPWYQPECVRKHLQDLSSYDETKRHLLMMRLANELEDYLDEGMAFRGTFPFQLKLEGYGKEVLEIARCLGRGQLAAELQEAFDRNLKAQLPDVVITKQRDSFQLPSLKWLKKSSFEKIQIKSREVIKRWTRNKNGKASLAGAS